MQRNERIEIADSLLNIRFVEDAEGARADRDPLPEGVPIAELGSVFIATQRIINKAYLSNEGRLIRGARLSREAQRRVALQIAYRRKGSDLYGLTSLIDDPVVVTLLRLLIARGLLALGAYAHRRLHLRTQREGVEDQQVSPMLIEAIFDEAKQLTQRVDQLGGTQQIELIPAQQVNAPTVIIDRDVKQYVRSLENQPFFGDHDQVVGYITDLDVDQKIAQVKTRPSGYNIVVRLNENLLYIAQYAMDNKMLVAFSGSPFVILGDTAEGYHGLVAWSLKILRR
jgi:hypothetical protein